MIVGSTTTALFVVLTIFIALTILILLACLRIIEQLRLIRELLSSMRNRMTPEIRHHDA